MLSLLLPVKEPFGRMNGFQTISEHNFTVLGSDKFNSNLQFATIYKIIYSLRIDKEC